MSKLQELLPTGTLVSCSFAVICLLQTACSNMFQAVSIDKDIVVPICNSIDSLTSSAEPALSPIVDLAYVAVGLAANQHHGCGLCYMCC